MLELDRLNQSWDLLIVTCAGPVDGSDVGSIFVPRESKSDFKDEFVGLSAELSSEKGHDDDKFLL